MQITKTELKSLIKEAINESLDEGIFDMFKKKKDPAPSSTSPDTSAKKTYSATDVKKTLDNHVAHLYGSYKKFLARSGSEKAAEQALYDVIDDKYIRSGYKWTGGNDYRPLDAIGEWIRAQR